MQGGGVLAPEQDRGDLGQCVRQGAVSYLNYRDARKKRLTGSSGGSAAMVVGSRRRLWLNCHAPAKRAGHVRGSGRDRGGQGSRHERSS
jgi:hypothetical protein